MRPITIIKNPWLSGKKLFQTNNPAFLPILLRRCLSRSFYVCIDRPNVWARADGLAFSYKQNTLMLPRYATQRSQCVSMSTALAYIDGCTYHSPAFPTNASCTAWTSLCVCLCLSLSLSASSPVNTAAGFVGYTTVGGNPLA